MVSIPPSVSSKEWRIRPLKRGDREVVFKLLAADGWVVPGQEQEAVLSWVVQHPEMESLVAHDAVSYGRVFGLITMSHRPQLKLGGRVASIDLFVVAPEHRHKGIGNDLLSQALRRAQALGCKRLEMLLPPARAERRTFFENYGFVNDGDDLFVRPVVALKSVPPR
ncbi:MAG TPA: GNAT family N-acetyltransferase [Myxococcales bacterium]|nr:GNAT family N-acetyltransferase [Myxococcales bacterium]